uniref:Protein embryo defective 2735 n=1 Tax=Tetraselmis sp. GSL018 TaxID=582737 RepID=A0A061RMU4_9CHLO
MAKPQRLWQRVFDYIRKDLPEIIVPSCLPDHPTSEKCRRLSWREIGQVSRTALKAYADSWSSSPSRMEELHREPEFRNSSLLAEIRDEFAQVAKGGAKGLAPYLHRLAHLRAAVVKDSINAFTEGYKDGLSGRTGPGSEGFGRAAERNDG